MQKETAAQVLLRTAQRYYKIRHLDSAIRKRLMALKPEDFDDEYKKLTIQVA